jgi:hypothetical protein
MNSVIAWRYGRYGTLRTVDLSNDTTEYLVGDSDSGWGQIGDHVNAISNSVSSLSSLASLASVSSVSSVSKLTSSFLPCFPTKMQKKKWLSWRQHKPQDKPPNKRSALTKAKWPTSEFDPILNELLIDNQSHSATVTPDHY